MIDAPIQTLIRKLNDLPYCFTLQSCYGHFVYIARSDPNNLDPLPREDPQAQITYRIAYLALCIENTARGEALLETLRRMPRLDPDNIQFGSPGWFWQSQVNTYALQVEPDRFKYQDQAVLTYDEALRIEKLRTRFYYRLGDEVERFIQRIGA